MSRQLWLPFGPSEHFQLLHGRHQAGISVCQARGRSWDNGMVYEHDVAGELVVGLAAGGAGNVYQSQNGFTGARRVSDRVAAITSCYVDLDTYNVPGLENVGPYELLERAQALVPWLPTPTAVFDSGRGFYFDWVFDKPLGPELLSRWQWVEDCLVDALRPLGADSHVRDAARVLRVVGTVNTKSGRVVAGYQQTGATMPFAKLERAVMAALPPKKDEGKRRRSARGEFIRHGSLAQARMADYHQLAILRGSPRLSDYRSRALYAYAMSGAWFWSCREQAEDELAAFSAEHFVDGQRYSSGRVRTVLERMEQAWAGVAQVWQGERVDRRYRPSNAYLMRLLEVTAEEQRHMRTLINREEKLRRLTEKRRAAGVVERKAYEGRAAERASEAVRLALEGWRQKDIAEALEITPARVSQLLKAAREGKT